MDLFGRLRIDSVKQVLKTALILVIREINKLLEFFLKAVSQEAVMNPCDSGYVDANNAKVFHLLG